MADTKVICLLTVVFFCTPFIFRIVEFLAVPALPKLESTWWGSGNASDSLSDTNIYPFKINITDQEINDLKIRLDNTKLPTPSLKNDNHYGVNSKLIINIVNFWKTKYDWKKTETFLNSLPQFSTNVQGLKIHYIHVKPEKTAGLKVLPLLLLNGWPSSVREFYGIIPVLTTPKKGYDFVFEVVVPSLPGFGFSDAPVRPGLGAAQMGLVFKNLMHRLGHKQFYLQGGDLGGIVIQHMAAMYPESVLGIHLNMCVLVNPLTFIKMFIYSIYPSAFVSKEHVDLIYPLSTFFPKIVRETGYLYIQATKPDTLGIALNESPSGLAAYIIEKFILGTNEAYLDREDGGLLEKYNYTILLDNVMIYWWTQTIQTSFRFYAEIFNKEHLGLGVLRQEVKVPSACARFKHDFYALNEVLSDIYINLLHTPTYDGGHFPSMETPEILSNDVFIAVKKFRAFAKKSVKQHTVP